MPRNLVADTTGPDADTRQLALTSLLFVPSPGRKSRHVNCSFVTAGYSLPNRSRGCIMRHAIQHEIEYLGVLGGKAHEDQEMIDELRQRLDTLRCYDQNFSETDWHPRAAGWPPESPLKLL